MVFIKTKQNLPLMWIDGSGIGQDCGAGTGVYHANLGRGLKMVC